MGGGEELRGADRDDVVTAVIEIPKGSRNKYEIDHDSGAVWLDRHLFTSTRYPADYGFIPDTLAEDGDPLDVMVLLDEPTFPGCHIRARVVAMFNMVDEAGPDAKLIAVPHGDPRWDRFTVLSDLPEHLRAEIKHFFEIYKALEPKKDTAVEEWQDKSVALETLAAARARH